jgi:hypothetical protein
VDLPHRIKSRRERRRHPRARLRPGEHLSVSFPISLFKANNIAKCLTTHRTAFLMGNLRRERTIQIAFAEDDDVIPSWGSLRVGPEAGF